MSFSKPPSALKRSRYFDNGSPTRCHYCGERFESSAIRDSHTNRYFCSASCLDAEEFVRSTMIPRKAS
jgi:hypothetical protein